MATLSESKIISEFQDFDVEIKCGSTLLERRERHLMMINWQTDHDLQYMPVDIYFSQCIVQRYMQTP